MPENTLNDKLFKISEKGKFEPSDVLDILSRLVVTTAAFGLNETATSDDVNYVTYYLRDITYYHPLKDLTDSMNHALTYATEAIEEDVTH